MFNKAIERFVHIVCGTVWVSQKEQSLQDVYWGVSQASASVGEAEGSRMGQRERSSHGGLNDPSSSMLDESTELSRAGPGWPGLYAPAQQTLWMWAMWRGHMRSARWLSAAEVSLKGLATEVCLPPALRVAGHHIFHLRGLLALPCSAHHGASVNIHVVKIHSPECSTIKGA